MSADQVYQSLVVLGAEPVIDPVLRPGGPQEEDRLHLLGRLLAITEREITAGTRLAEADEIEDVLHTLLGWSAQVADPSRAADVLVNRLQRTAIQLSKADEGQPPTGRDAAFAAVTTAVYALSAQLAVEDGDAEATRRFLGQAEAALTDIVQGIRDLRLAIGHPQEKPED
ncbi:hypothetical protein ACFY3O_36330 [Streptomyces sp. NPDC001046]|uniref:hypothetical protein n=1 Tax=Streptomyces sp. NPDC001046 TaxID=3364543 RepID=UPI0036BB7D4D